MTETLPLAHYLILSSRLIPGLDGGYTIATLARAGQMAETGADSVRLMTFDPGTAAAHREHRAEFGRRGQIARRNAPSDAPSVAGDAPRGVSDHESLRNLFDEAGADRSWLVAASRPGTRDADLEYRELADAAGRPLAALPNVPDPSGWHLSTAPVVVYTDAGREAGVVPGFGALYLAWLDHVVSGLRAVDGRPVVVICESRQLGEILSRWSSPGVRIVHTIHTMHVESPFTPDAPLNALWERWFSVAPRFDAIAWPTGAQRDDVIRRFGGDNHVVVPNGVAAPDAVTPPGERTPGLAVMVNRLAPGKRVDHGIRAFLAADVPGSRLDVYGDGGERARLQELVDGLGAADRVALRGVSHDVGAVLGDASLFVTSTEYEGQGLAIVEALAHGCPVVGYDIRYGPADALARGGGLLVPDADETALAAAIRLVLTDAVARERFSSQAPDTASRWSPAAAMAAMGDAVRGALAGPRRR